MFSPVPPLEQEVRSNLRHNFTVNLFDGAFFGLALGFSSFSAFIPIFVSRMTTSALLIGLVPAMHNVGWQLPQLMTAGWIARLRRYKPTVLLLTIHERIPFLGLALIAWFLPGLGKQVALILTFLMLAWQGLGGGVTANPWTSMIAKIIPGELRGTFFGSQAAAANALLSVGSIAAGFLLASTSDRIDFSLLFLLTCGAMAVSWIFLSRTREPEDLAKVIPAKKAPFWKGTRSIFRRDPNFRWFLLSRLTVQIANMGFAFYIIYAVQFFGMDDITAGIMAATMTITNIFANPIMGWLGDRWSHRLTMTVGIMGSIFGNLLAWKASSLGWFYLVMVLSALANVAVWTIAMTMTVEFGTEAERPVYIGMSNTLIAPAAILAPIFGGWLADRSGYPATFLVSAIGGFLTVIVLLLLVRDPQPKRISPTT